MTKRFQNIVATGRLTLPITVAYAVIMLFICGAVTSTHLIQLLLLGLSTFGMVVMNNSNALIRVFSRMVSCSFLAMMMMNPAMLDSIKGCSVQLLFILMVLFLFRVYQDRLAMGTVFYAFACLGLISTQFIQIIFFVPFIWILMFTSLQEGSLRVFVASLIGLILPYLFWICYTIYEGSPLIILEHLESVTIFEFDFKTLLNPSVLISLIFIFILGITSTIHYLATGYSDNIKTRMFYNVFITLFWISILFVILQPQHYDYLFRIAIICLSPLIAHFFTFTNSWLTNISFYGVIAATISITILNTWIF